MKMKESSKIILLLFLSHLPQSLGYVSNFHVHQQLKMSFSNQKIDSPISQYGSSFLLSSQDLSENQSISQIIIEKLRTASVPDDINDLFALSIAETIAGVIGGISSSKMAEILQNKKNTSFSSAVSAGAFFGTRGFVRLICKVMGFPKPLTIFIASFLGSVVSQRTKSGVLVDEDSYPRTSYAISQQYQEAEGLATKDNKKIVDTRDTKDKMLSGEALGEITKWLIYDALVESTEIPETTASEYATYFWFGAVASTLSQLMTDKNTFKNPNLNAIWKNSVEGGVLFLVYESIHDALIEIFPQFMGQDMLFSKWIRNFEIYLGYL